jgi:two-component system sensor histidine kinase EvgS
LLDIVTDIVEIARVQSNSTVLNLSPVNIRHLIYESIKDVQSKIGSKNIDFRVFIPDDLDISLETDEFKISRSIKHLLENAIKFTSEGTVELTTGLVNGNHLFIKVMDTGTGIAEDLQNVIFEPFRQVETLMTRNYGGNGVGLPLIKAYMNMLGGTVDLKSTEEVGTTVNLNIPLSAYLDEKKHKSVSMTDIPPEKDKKVLIVDDELANCIYMKEVLGELDFKIMCAENGKEAVDYCKEKPVIDIVLMDIKMPIMDGYEATKRIKDENPEITVIAQTAFTSDRDVQRIKNHGFDDYLSKPIRREELLNVLKMYIGV